MVECLLNYWTQVGVANNSIINTDVIRIYDMHEMIVK